MKRHSLTAFFRNVGPIILYFGSTLTFHYFNEQPTGQPTNWLTTNWPTNWPTNQPTGRPTNRPANQLAIQPTGQPTNWLTNQLTNWPTNKLTDRKMHHQNYFNPISPCGLRAFNTLSPPLERHLLIGV